jgi:hypothetical protein
MDSTQSSIDFYLLLPRIGSQLLDTNVTTQDLSAYIILLMIIVLIGAMIFVIVRYFASTRLIKFLRNILSDVTPETLAVKRRDLLKKAEEYSQPVAIWKKFDETLASSYDGNVLHNTIDPAYIFNAHNLARGITESRLLAALPGIFTAMGVFGTFVGLQLGLSSLNLEDRSNLDQSILPLINGAAVAFSTSVWGVGASMIFNFIEKLIEQLLRRKIYLLQQRINELFPSTIAEQTLINIEHHNSQSEDILKGLGEQIGDQMQKAMAEVANGVNSGIQEAISPAVDQLVIAANELSSRQEVGSARTLEALVGKFADSVGQMGQEHRQVFERTASDVHGALGQWVASMGDMTNKMDTKLQAWSNLENQRESAFNDQMALLNQYQQSTTEKVDEILRRNMDSAEQLMAQGRQLNEQAQTTGATVEVLSGKLSEAAAKLEGAANGLASLGAEIANASDTLSGAQVESAHYLEASARDSQAVSQATQQLILHLDQAGTNIESVSSELKQSAQLANTTFSELRNDYSMFLDELSKRVTEFGGRVNDMLVDYSSRVRGQTEERLREWNDQTSKFSSTMVDAVTTMQDVLNEIEDSFSSTSRSISSTR